MNGYPDAGQTGPSKPSSRQNRNRPVPSDMSNQNVGYKAAPTTNNNNAYSKPLQDDFFEKMISGDDNYGRSNRQATNN